MVEAGCLELCIESDDDESNSSISNLNLSNKSISESILSEDYLNDSFDSSMEEDSPEMNIFYKWQSIEVPKELLRTPLHELFNPSILNEFTSEEKQHLRRFLPRTTESNEWLIHKLFIHQPKYFPGSIDPVCLFQRMLRNLYFTKDYQKYLKCQHKLWIHKIIDHLKECRDEGDHINNINNNINNVNKEEELPNFSELRGLWDIEESSDYELSHIMKSETSSDSENASEGHSHTPKIVTPLLLTQGKDPLPVSSSAKASTPLHSIPTTAPQGNSILPRKKAKGNFPDIDWVHDTERFRNLKVHKNQLTIKKGEKKWIEYYRLQERGRYETPTRPWVYMKENKSQCVVAPVCKKNLPASAKPRDHFMLTNDRPACITLLCLARDAAARLPDGVGTRADICELIKESQYMVEGIGDVQLNNIVSGALDRLHYEKDPCVRYDSERKLWIYLHKTRNIDFPGWENKDGRENSISSNSLPVHLRPSSPISTRKEINESAEISESIGEREEEEDIEGEEEEEKGEDIEDSSLECEGTHSKKRALESISGDHRVDHHIEMVASPPHKIPKFE